MEQQVYLITLCMIDQLREPSYFVFQDFPLLLLQPFIFWASSSWGYFIIRLPSVFPDDWYRVAILSDRNLTLLGLEIGTEAVLLLDSDSDLIVFL